MNEKPPPRPTYWSEVLSDASGIKALKEGKVAVILLAGGSGSRLGWKKPKGVFPITPYRQRTFFQLFSDKIDAASTLYQYKIPVAILTSPENDEETKKALNRSDWDLCPQKERPYLEEDKKKETGDQGPDGNGGVFEIMFEAGVLERWKKKGIEVISIAVVDNPLDDPIDVKWLSLHFDKGYDLTVRVVERLSPEEKVGVLVQTEDGLRIMEYTETQKGLEYLYGNEGLYLFNIDVAIEGGQKTALLPYHLQWKKIKDDKWGWKQERLIFDHFRFAKHIGALVSRRGETFAPLKKMEDLEGVKKALIKKERGILERITGTKIPPEVIEIDPSFYYPTPSLLKRWRDKKVSHSPYIDAQEGE